MNFDPRNPLPVLKGHALQMYLELEELRMVAEGYEESEKVVLRKIALRWILQVTKCENFDASVPYIAMNYFDRFISRHQVPLVMGGFRTDLYVFCLSCVMLAWKLRYQRFKSETFLEQNDLKFLQTSMLKMEVEILNGLNWKMLPITALCFVDLIIERLPDANGINRRFINEIIIQTQADITYTRFRQSLIAASAILSACRALYSDRYNRCREILLALEFVNADHLDTCTNKISAMCVDKRITVHGHLDIEAVETSQVGAGISEARQSSQVGAGTAEAEGTSQVGAGTAEAGQSSQVGAGTAEAEGTSQVGAGTAEAGQSSQVGAGTAEAGQSSQEGEISQAGQWRQVGETSEAGRISVFGETSEGILTSLFGEEAAASESGQISEGETSSIVMVPRRPGKEPIEETSAPELTRQRAMTRERVQEITEIQHAQDPGSRDIDDLTFELKWLLWNADIPEDLVIDPARFRPMPGVEAQADADSNAITQKCACNVM